MRSFDYSRSFVGIVELYKVSYVWYSLIGAFTCIIIGVLVSLCTGWYFRLHIDYM